MICEICEICDICDICDICEICEICENLCDISCGCLILTDYTDFTDAIPERRDVSSRYDSPTKCLLMDILVALDLYDL